MAYWPLPNVTPSNRVHADQQLLAVGRAAERRRSHRFARRSCLQRSLAQLRALLLLERVQSAVQQLRQPRLVVRGGRPDLHEGAQPVDRSQLFVRADLGAERALRPQPPPRRSPAAVGRLRPREPGAAGERDQRRRCLRVPARQRAEFPVARPEHVHRPEDRPDDPQLQRERDESVGRAHNQGWRRLPQVLPELHAALLPVGPVRVQQRAVDAAQPERVERHAGGGAGLDAPRHSQQREPEPQPRSRVVERVCRWLRAGRLEARPQLHRESRAPL